MLRRIVGGIERSGSSHCLPIPIPCATKTAYLLLRDWLEKHGKSGEMLRQSACLCACHGNSEQAQAAQGEARARVREGVDMHVMIHHNIAM
jgi:hypothetical protein